MKGIRRSVEVAVVGAIICLAVPSWARITLLDGEMGKLVASGFFRVQADIHTAEPNPNNQFIPEWHENDDPLARRENNRLQLFRTWMLSDFIWETPNPGVKFFARTRVWFDTTADADGDVPEYDAFPTDVPGDVWFLRANSDDVAAEIWELWGDFNVGNLWLRFGRQTIVWGDVAPTRLLDDINPLDVSWHLVLEPLGKEVFDQLRIPLWAARASYSLPFAPDFQLEGYVSPDEFAFVSTQLPAEGSPLNPIGPPLTRRQPTPPFRFVTLRDDIQDGQNGVSGGIRLLGTVRSVNFSLNWLQRHSADGINVDDGLIVPLPGSPVVLDFDMDGTPETPVGFRLRGTHPRFDTVGFSFNYFEQFTKVVARVEGVWDIKRPFDNIVPTGVGPHFRRRHQWGYAIALDRPTFLIRSDRTASITLQFEQRFREGGDGDIGTAGVGIERNSELFTLLFGQAFRGFGGRYDEWFFDFALLADTDKAFAIVPLVRFEPGNNWRFNLWYNLFLGPEDTPITGTEPGGFGSQTWANGVNISVSYQF